MKPSIAYNQLPAKRIAVEKEHWQEPHPSSWLSLLVGAGLLLFSYGANNVPVAAWFSPIFLLRFVRQQKFRLWLPLLYLTAIVAIAFQLRGMVPIPGLGYLIFLAISGLQFLIPYLADRLLASRIGGLLATLVFPSAWVVLEYINSFGPYGSWGVAAYSQYGDLALLQVLSVTGLWGVSFLIGWFAAVCNWLWEEGWNSTPARRGVYLCITTIAAVMLAGGARMALFPPSSPTVRIASLSKRKIGVSPTDATWNRLLSNQPTPEDLDSIRNWGAAVDNDLLARAESEGQAGAKIVFWGEANAPIFKEDEAAFISRGAELAYKYQMYLGMALGVWNTGKNPPLENKLVLLQPNGRVAWEYNKVRPVPGPEAAMQIRGDGKLRSLDTPYGRLSSVICFDADFPQLLRQAGALGTDILLDPSNDWRAIDPWHTQMASFRAIEEGVNLVRHTSQGLSAAFDYQGRRLSAMDDYYTAEYDLVSEIPTRGVRTIYSRLGDWLAWLCAAAFLMFVSRFFRHKRA